MRPFTFQRDTHQTATSSPWQYRSHDEDDSQRRLDALECPRLVITGGEPLLQQAEL